MNELKIQEFKQEMMNKDTDFLLDEIHKNNQIKREFERRRIEIDICVAEIDKKTQMLEEIVSDIQCKDFAKKLDECVTRFKSIVEINMQLATKEVEQYERSSDTK